MDIRYLPEDIRRLLGGSIQQCLVVVDPLQPDQPVVYASPYFYETTLFVPMQVIGRNCRFLQGPETDPVDRLALRAAITAQAPIVRTVLNYRADGSMFRNKLDLRPLHDSQGRLFSYLGFQNPE